MMAGWRSQHLQRRPAGRRRLRVHAQGPPRDAHRARPYLALELRDRTGAVAARAFRDADVLAGRFERGDLVRVARARGPLPRRAAGRGARDRPRGRRRRGPVGVPPDRLPRPRRARRLPRAPGRRGQPPRPARAAGRHARRRRAARRRCGARRARAAATTPTSAGCWSTPSPSRRSRRRPARCTSGWTPICSSTAAIVHDLGKTREFTYGAEIGLSDEGRLLGHVELGLRMLDERAARVPALDDARAARARALRAHPPRARTRRPRGGSRSAEAVALFRINALDAAVKGAIEHGPAGPAGA